MTALDCEDLMGKTFAFIDESGNIGLDFEKPGNSKMFIIVAIIVREDDLQNLEALIERQKDCQLLL